MVHTIAIPTPDGDQLNAKQYKNDKSSHRCVIFSHGLFSSQDGYKIQNLAEDILSTGTDLLTCNFSYVEKGYEHLSFIRSMDELNLVINHVAAEYDSLFLMGSSMGAAVTMAVAADVDVVKKIMLIAPPADMKEVVRTLIGNDSISGYGLNGSVPIDGIDVPVRYLRELWELDLLSGFRKVHQEITVIHGTDDPLVPFHHSALLRQHCAGKVTVVAVPGGGHNLTEDGEMEVIREEVLKWAAEKA